MNWQLVLTIGIILIAAAFVVRAAVRTLLGRGRGGCGSGCSKCAAPEPAPAPGRIGLPQLPSRS